ncbi:hypothetical protein FNV43_RR23346 [Rhamnella rubrinervis]|uniref:PGG domain-containing protein n=1 Tax=Rhamnella rubrinervis TaxID=2594499 RepID=A0A8K0GRZ7_9ROSA|nr:hypothetical protein FNV43_RR23346 [Rhamnella rubrinervis]
MAADMMKDEKTLFTLAMKGEWKEVLEICEQDVRALKLKITKSGATVLQVAVTESQVYTVRALLALIVEKSEHELLRLQNNGGYTALHLAASMGSVVMCRCIAEIDPALVGVRNKSGETPLFLAALHGKSTVFLYLNSRCSTELGYSSSRRKDGDTFLHCAIAGEYMGLAYQIIEKYPNLVHSVNEKGYSPLHVLATKPASFKSGNHDFGRFRRFVYDHCISINQLEFPDEKDIVDPDQGTDEITKSKSQKEKSSKDIENPETSTEHDDMPPPGRQQLQPKRSMFCDFIVLSFMSMFTLGTKCTMMLNSFIEDIREVKMKHRWSIEIMKELIEKTSIYDYVDPAGPNKNQDEPLDKDEDNPKEVIIKAAEEEEKKGQKGLLTTRGTVASETAILVAAKNGIIEIVGAILTKFPVAINDRDASKKNIVILAAENRRVSLFNVLIKKNLLRESIVRKRDDQGNSALHVAAVYAKDKVWPIPGAAAQMQWEIKWFEHVKSSLPRISFRPNNEEKTPEEMFTETHEELVTQGADWLVKTSESCSVVSALIAGVAFATSASIPGGVEESTGKPKLEKHAAFEVFAISSLIALCLSITSLTMFLSILTSRFQERDFAKDLPGKLLVGMTSLFISIGAMLVSFSSGHSLVTEDRFRYAVFPVYAVACLPISIFAVAQFPLYVDLIRTNFKSRFAYQE